MKYLSLVLLLIAQASSAYLTPIGGGGGGGVTSVTGTAPIASSGGATPNITCSLASGSTTGCLSSANWNTFNGKQDALGFTPVNIGGDTMTGALEVPSLTASAGITISGNGISIDGDIKDANGATLMDTSVGGASLYSNIDHTMTVDFSNQLQLIDGQSLTALSWRNGDRGLYDSGGNEVLLFGSEMTLQPGAAIHITPNGAIDISNADHNPLSLGSSGNITISNLNSGADLHLNDGGGSAFTDPVGDLTLGGVNLIVNTANDFTLTTGSSFTLKDGNNAEISSSFSTGQMNVHAYNNLSMSANTGFSLDTGSGGGSISSDADLSLTSGAGGVNIQAYNDVGVNPTGGGNGNLNITMSHITTGGTAPAVSACGTSPSISGNDKAGKVTIGTGGVVSSCTLTFAVAYTSAPHCFLNDQTEIIAVKGVPSTSTLVISKTTPFTASSVIDYFCVQ